MFLDIAILPSIPSFKVPWAASLTFNVCPAGNKIESGCDVPIPTLNVSVPIPLIILKDVLFNSKYWWFLSALFTDNLYPLRLPSSNTIFKSL